MLKTIFQGTYGFIDTVKNEMPLAYFLNWLKYKWLADLRLIPHVILFAPVLILLVLNVIFEGIGLLLERLKCSMPDWMFIPSDYRKDQFAAAQDYREARDEMVTEKLKSKK